MATSDASALPLDPAARRTALTKFLFTSLIGGFFFLFPVNAGGSWTIPFDLAVTWIQNADAASALNLVGHYCALVIVGAAVLTVLAKIQAARGGFPRGIDLAYFNTGWLFVGFRVLGAVLALMINFDFGPGFILAESTGVLMFDTLVASVALIVPIGAVFITMFVAFGALDFVGTLARPLMRPLFRSPGRSALDGIASFVGSYSVGLYVTNLMYKKGRYTGREAAIVATCSSTVSIGFVAVVTGALDLTAYFPLVFISTAVVSVILGVILCRIPPLSRKTDDYAPGVEAVPEVPYKGDLLRNAGREALRSAASAGTVVRELWRGLIDGFKLAGVILPSILSIGLIAVLVAEHTPLFNWLGAPVEPVLRLLGLPDAEIIAPATLIGISEMFLPALISTAAAVPAKFFIAVLSLVQLMFFSATIPLMLQMEVPIKLKDCLLLFLLRTVISIPIIAVITHLVFGL